jgi:fermentation-respiration switch protein FrsA (DUF1100 family)
MISLLAVDPPALARAYRGRILIVNGTNDLQTPLADARLLADARPGIVLRVIEGMNHVLKSAPADFNGNFATYGNPDLPLAPGLIDAVAGFILSEQRLPR